MTTWREPAFVAQVTALRQQGLSHAAIAAELKVSKQCVWQAIHQRRSGLSWDLRPDDARPRCRDCAEPISDPRYPRCRACAGKALSARMLTRGGNVRRCLDCFSTLEGFSRRKRCANCAAISAQRQRNEWRQAKRVQRAIQPQDDPPEVIEAKYQARLAEIRRERPYTVDAWARREGAA